MSLRPGLLASTSRVYSATAGASRSISSTAWLAQKSAQGASVQLADKQKKDQERMMRRMPVGIDLSARMNAITFEPIVDPDFQLGWLRKKGSFTYIRDRVKRWFTTKKTLYDICNKGRLPDEAVRATTAAWLKNVIFGRVNKKYPLLLQTLEDTYKEYQTAQAAGSLAGVARTSVGPAKEKAEKIASVVRKGQWELVKNNRPPYVVSARVAPIDLNDETATMCQVVVRFDTIQKFTTPRSTRQVHVVENVVFDNKPGQAYYYLKDTLPFTEPDFLQVEKMVNSA